MNPPTTYGVIAFQTDKKRKRALINYSKESGRSIKSLMNEKLEELLMTPNPTKKITKIRFRTKRK